MSTARKKIKAKKKRCYLWYDRMKIITTALNSDYLITKRKTSSTSVYRQMEKSKTEPPHNAEGADKPRFSVMSKSEIQSMLLIIALTMTREITQNAAEDKKD